MRLGLALSIFVFTLAAVLTPTMSGCRGETPPSPSPLPPAAVTPKLLRGL